MSARKSHGSYKNLPNIDTNLVIESDVEDEQDTLNLISQNLCAIPPQIALNKASFVTSLILSKNTFKSLHTLKFFKNLISLQLDRNKLKHIKDLPKLHTLTTLWLNNNNLTNLNLLLSILSKQTPKLEYLSLLCNPLCPTLNESKSSEECHKQYRIKIIHYLKKLKFLDTEPVTMSEREQSEEFKEINIGYDSPQNSPNSDNEDISKYHQKDRMIKYELKGEIFRLYSYYKPIQIIGSGAYGVVCSAMDTRNNKKIAIKKSKYIFNDLHDAKKMIREIKLLSFFTKSKHEDIIEIYDCVAPRPNEIDSFKDIYIMMPFYETNLLKIINSKQKLSHSHFQYLTYQILRGLKCIHESGVIHRDIKPENILINGTECDVKIIDFGISRGVDMNNDIKYNNANITEYVCTRWYRAPEVMCNPGKYDKKMDIWSVGCILGEMITKKALFPGKDYMDQLQWIFNTMYDDEKESTEWIINKQCKQWINNNLKNRQNSTGKTLRKTILEIFVDENKLNTQCIDLLYKLLTLNPQHRISANDGLKHPYFQTYFENEEKINNEQQINNAVNPKKFDLSFEFEKIIETGFGLRHLMQAELNKIHQKRWKKILKKQQKRKETLKKRARAKTENHISA